MSQIRSWRFWLGCSISLLCLWLALRNVSPGEVATSLSHANLGWILMAIILQLMAIIVRAWRWVVLLDQKKRIVDSFWAQSIGYLFTNIFPLRLGEPARVVIMAARCGIPLMSVAASAVLERLLDVAAIVLALALVLPLMSVPVLVVRAGTVFGVLTIAGFVACFLAVRFSHTTERVLRYLCRFTPFLPAEKVISRWRELMIGFAPVTRWDTALQSVLLSIICWGFSIAMYWSVIQSFQPAGTFVESAFLTIALSLAVTVPSSPGFIGVFQLVGQQALVLPFGAKYDSGTALAIILTGHLVYYVLTTSLGVVGLWRLGESFAHIGRLIKAKKPIHKVSEEALL